MIIVDIAGPYHIKDKPGKEIGTFPLIIEAGEDIRAAIVFDEVEPGWQHEHSRYKGVHWEQPLVQVIDHLHNTVKDSTHCHLDNEKLVSSAEILNILLSVNQIIHANDLRSFIDGSGNISRHYFLF